MQRLPLTFAFLMAVLPILRGQQAKVQTGNGLLAAGKPSEARDIFESILTADPASDAAQNGELAASEQIALQQRAGKLMTDALQTLMRAQKFAPRNARLAYDVGILEDEMHLYPEAAKSLDEAAQLGYENPALLYAQARVCMDQQQLGPAEEKILAYLKLRPSDATAYYGLGRIYQLGLEFDKARLAFEESVRIKPEQTEAWYQLGDIALKQNHDDEALTDFNRTLARDPRHGGALAGAGQACFHKKQYSLALDYLNRAIAAAPDYAPAHYYLGLTLARLGRTAESQRELASAAKLADAENRESSTRFQLRPSTPPD